MNGKRLDIQALRAIAVLLVIANHLTAWPTGGYIGVDIFFVVSGYLITGHLMREATETGRVRLARFWSRRAKRLLPAALVVLGASTVLTMIWLPITARQASLEQIRAAAAYFLNWLLSSLSLDYFADVHQISPVTHYWSLSVEEQFYVLWPLAIIVLFFLGRWSSARIRRAIVVVGLFAIAAASLAWGIHSSATQPESAYFELGGRIWEFAIGGLLVFLPAIPERWKPRFILVSWAAWATIAYAALTFDSTSGFPGAWALVPVVAVAALIAVGDIRSTWSPEPLTSFGPVQFVGDISYSLYLWHWPLIVAAPFVLGHELTLRWKIAILVATVVLAYLTKRFVEDTVRFAKFTPLQRPYLVLLAAALSIVLVFVGTAPLLAQIERRAADAATSLNEQALDPEPCFGAQAALSGAVCPGSNQLADQSSVLVGMDSERKSLSNGSTCNQKRDDPALLRCSFGVPEGEQTLTVALAGDSHALMWAQALDGISAARGLRVQPLTHAGCPVMLYGTPLKVVDEGTFIRQVCSDWSDSVAELIATDSNIDIVVTSSRARNHTLSGGRPDDGSRYVPVWQMWLKAGKRVIVIEDVPTYESSVLDCLAIANGNGGACTKPTDKKPSPLALAAAEISDPNFVFIDYTDVFCDSARCQTVVGGIPAYMDAHHLSPPFARSFGQGFLAEALDN